IAQIAICGRNATSTRASPFFLQHSYNIKLINLDEEDAFNLEAAARAIVEKFKATFKIVQSNMAVAQQEQEQQANRH
ncbi:hypothetical protein K504DRAFT_386387, partial [Pleomassaria siparia CBS 279.74]